MAQANILKCRGLYTFQNNLSEIPEGSLVEADNIVIDREGVIGPRRGFELYGSAIGSSTANRAKQLFTYKNRVFRHWGVQIDYDSDGEGNFLSIPSNNVAISEVKDGDLSLRLKTLEANGNLYMTTASGIKKVSASELKPTYVFTLSANSSVTEGAVYKDEGDDEYAVSATITASNQLKCTGTIEPVPAGTLTKVSGNGPATLIYTSSMAVTDLVITSAGGIKALDLAAKVIDKPGFFTQDSACAYRLVWGIKDNNNNLILGSPSEMVTVYNSLLATLIRDYTDICDDLAAARSISTTDALSDTDYASLYASLNANPTAPTLHTKLTDLCKKLDTDLSVNKFYGKTGTITAIDPIDGSAEITSANHGLSVGDKIVIKNSIPNIDDTHTVTQVPTYYTFTLSSALGTTEKVVKDDVYKDTANNTFTVRYALIGGATKLVCTGSVAPVASGTLTLVSGTSKASLPYTAFTTTTNTFRIATSVLSTGTASGNWQQQSIATKYSEAPTVDATNEQLVSLQKFYNAIIDELNAMPSFTISSVVADSGKAKVTTTAPHGLTGTVNDVLVVSGTAKDASGNTLNDKYTVTVVDATSFTINFPVVTPGTDGSVFLKVYSTARDSAATELTFSIPEGITTKHFYQIYRSPLKSADGTTTVSSLTVSDDLKFAFEGFLTQSEINAGFFTTEDNTDDEFLDADLYTNANSGEGIAYANEAPPVAKDIALFKGSVFYANTVVKQRKNFSLLSGLADDLVGKKFIIGRSDNPNAEVEFTFVAAGAATLQGDVEVSNSTTVSQKIDDTARALVRAINRHNDSTVYAYYMSAADDVPGAILLEDRELGRAAFYIRVNDSSISESFNPVLPTTTIEKSDSEVNPNRVFFSKYQQPEAVPLVNYFDIGPKDKKIIRVLALRDSLFVIKEDGIYKVTGEFGQFQVSLFDNSSKCVAPDTAAVLNNQIYMFSNQGIATISDTGVSVISRPIENRLLELTSHEYKYFASASFAIPYESDRAYMLWTVKNSSDQVATQCFRYNTFTNTWTRWSVPSTCGVISSEDDRMYLGASDVAYIERERKNFTRLDHADREYSFSIPVGAVNEAELSLGGLYGMDVGDVVVQTQYLSVAQFNRLLKKLDQDSGLADSDYYSKLKASTGSNLFELFITLVDKLNADARSVAGTPSSYSASLTSDLEVLQEQFNTVIDTLNNDDTVSSANFVHSSGTVQWEASVASINTYTKKITLSSEIPLITGDCVFYKHIKSSATWAPQHFGDPATTKQVRETTMIFQNNSFVQAEASYATDLSTGFLSVPFKGEGTGTWGGFSYGQATWGGEGTSKPLRTYVPREKQRCRYITAKFDHAVAFENYSILGLSFTYEPVSSRGYR